MSQTIYNWQQPSELRWIDQQLMAQLTLDDELFKLFPVRQTPSAMVTWRQRDNYLGLTQIRGYDGAFARVNGVEASQYVMLPGVYGEHTSISEFQLTTEAAPGALGVPISVETLVAQAVEYLVTRRVNRMTWVLSQLISTGSYVIPGPTDAIVHRDAFQPQRYTAPVTWATSASARPLDDFRNVQLLQRGQSARFGVNAKAIMNQATYNAVATNQNANDYFGLKGEFGQSIQGLGLVNKVLLNNNLPQIVIDDSTYLSDGTDGNTAGQYVLRIPNNTVILVGERTNGASVGEFLLTRQGSDMAGSSAPMMRVVDRGARPDDPPPRRIEVYSAFTGGPCVFYPGSIVVLSV